MAQARLCSCKAPHGTISGMNRLVLVPGCLATLLFSSCSGPQPAAERGGSNRRQRRLNRPDARSFHMYQVARASWALDAQVVKMSSMHVDGVPTPLPGQAAAWEATFYSPSLGRARSYTDSIVEQLPDLHKDVFAGPQEPFTGASFLIAAVKKDAEGAYQTALIKAGKDAEKYTGKGVLILLEKNTKYPDPAWRIVWGESVSTAAVSVFIDASTGEYLDTMH